MMKKKWIEIGFLLVLFQSCIRETYHETDCLSEIDFKMSDIPYVFHDNEGPDYAPYYRFTEQLNVFAFEGGKLRNSVVYDYQYCKDHPVISFSTVFGFYQFLFVANLFDPKVLDWSFEQGRLNAVFSILHNQEPSPLLIALNRLEFYKKQEMAVGLHLLISHLEIRLERPPAWVKGLEVNIRDVARTIDAQWKLRDTTHIQKVFPIENPDSGTFRFGINTFPTFPEHPAIVEMRLIGGEKISVLLVDDDRLHLTPGIITRLSIAFQDEGKVEIAVEVDGKWEIVDEGNIII